MVVAGVPWGDAEAIGAAAFGDDTYKTVVSIANPKNITDFFISAKTSINFFLFFTSFEKIFIIFKKIFFERFICDILLQCQKGGKLMNKLKQCCAVFLFTLILSGCAQKTEVETVTVEEAIAVETSNIKLSGIKNEMIYAGKVNAKNSISVISKMAGKVSETFFDVGQNVSTGAVLFKLDENDVRNQIKQLEASLGQAETSIQSAKNSLETVTGGQYESQLVQLESSIANYTKQIENARVTSANAEIGLTNAQNNLDTVQKTYDSMKTLYAAGAIARNEFDKANTAYTQALAGVDTAKNSRDQAAIAIEQLETALENTKRSYELTKGQITDENRQKASLGVNTAEASKNTISVQLDIAQSTLKDTAVTSPISGVISVKNAKAGEFVSSQSPAYIVVDIDTVNVDVKVSELIINSLSTGKQVPVYIRSISEEPIMGEITTVSPSADQSGMFPVKVEIKNADHKIKPGMFANIHFVKEEKEGTYVLPRNVVLESANERYVFVADNGVARKAVVQTGIDNGKEIEVLSGINGEDNIIVKGQSYLSDGDKINVTN